MSLTCAASSSSRSSSGNQRNGQFSALISHKSRLRNPLLLNLSVFPSFVHPSRRSLSKLIISRNSIRPRIGVLLSGEGVGRVQRNEVQVELSFDEFLSAAEIICIVPPFIFSIGCLLGLVIPGASRLFQFSLGNKFCVGQFFFLIFAVVVGGLIRRRQWRSTCRGDDGVASVDLVARIEKVEQDMRSSSTIVRVLSRQLEKLSIRLRVTRKALKDPIAETATLAKKNSEATRVLAMQEDILEKELVEIQKVLLAMQEHQQKQLELILAIGKAGKLFESKQFPFMEQEATRAGFPIPGKREGQEVKRQTVDGKP
ncbi:hypothetical protein KSP39_PZI020355 [Platanthera zijinensis]|uniref:Uncharacterized protein n=1 Tax=Platanthera zijinensis TaxID=2320716 RepID=A0AAP0FXD0_9ASPA